MTAPDLSTIIPLKYKAWVGLAGTILTLVLPYVLEAVAFLPQPWPIVAGGVVALLTAFGIYKAPYVPPGAVVVPTPPVLPYSPPTGEYQSPWPKP